MTAVGTKMATEPPRRTSIISFDSDDEDSQETEQGESGYLDREACCTLARTAMQYTAPIRSPKEREYGRQLLSEATSRRRIPGFNDGEQCTMQDCLTAYYLSQANGNLGRENSQHYHLQEALTLVESLVLRREKVGGSDEGLRKYEFAKVNARAVLEEWTGLAATNQPTTLV